MVLEDLGEPVAQEEGTAVNRHGSNLGPWNGNQGRKAKWRHLGSWGEPIIFTYTGANAGEGGQ